MASDSTLKANILLVDDDPRNLSALDAALHDVGNLVPATSGEQALRRLRCPRELVIVPGATHLFEEPGTLEEVARLATGWFHRHLAPEGTLSGGQ